MATEKRLIDANDLKKSKTYMWDNALGYCECVMMDDIDNATTVDAVEVVHGRWIEKPYLLGTTRCCSVCGQNYGMPHGVFNYCPNCGAKMDEERKDK